MGFISFGSKIKNRRFDYVPRYYDPEKEEREARIKQYTKEYSESDTELAQSRIRASFRKKYRVKEDAYMSKSKKRSNRILMMVLVLLLIVCYIFLTEHLPRIVEFLEK